MDINTLTKEAIEVAEWRSHTLTEFVDKGSHKRTAHCRECGMTVVVNSDPLPNQIDISGRAVAVDCTSE